MWKPNETGRCPREAVGKRVIVKLRNGDVCGEKQVTSVSPIGWDAKTTVWADRGFAFDVVEYRVLA